MSANRFTYRSVLESEGKMYDDIKGYLTECKISSKLCHNILLAISEAFTNALLHGNKLDPNKSIEISITVNDNEITADIVDEGSGNPDGFETGKNTDLWQEGGRGLMLMETLTDMVAFAKNPDTGGLQVSMIFRLQNQSKIENITKV